MARTSARERPDQETVLWPIQKDCPACGIPMRVRYENRRTVVTLSGTQMGWTAPERHRCATLRVVGTCNRGVAHHEHYHDWLGYRQVRLPNPRRQRDRKGRAQAQGAPERLDCILRDAGTLHSCDGGLWRRASLGAHSR